jgi:hypothetical protein
MELLLPVLGNAGHHALGMALPLSENVAGEKWLQHY